MLGSSMNIESARWLPVWILGGLLLAGSSGLAQRRASELAPAQADVSYGPHERNVLDLWLAEAATPRPLVIYIHGGGFRGGSKNSLDRDKVKQFLDAGISVAALHYRLLAQAYLPAAHHDCRRAIQFLRSKAGEWNLDVDAFGAFGGSAGAQLCMYLAFHDDMADATSDSLLEQQSTRLRCVATSGGQTTMSFKWWKEHIPGYDRPHRPISEYFGQLSEGDLDRVVRELSALSLLSEDDPPIYMRYGMAPGAPQPDDVNRVQGWRVHHVNFGVALLEKAKQLGVPAYLKYPGSGGEPLSDVDFFRKHLLEPQTSE